MRKGNKTRLSQAKSNVAHSRIVSNELLPQRLEEYRIRLTLLLGRRIVQRMRNEKGSIESYLQQAAEELKQNQVPQSTIKLIVSGAREVVDAILEKEPLITSTMTLEEKKALFEKKEYLRLVSKNTP